MPRVLMGIKNERTMITRITLQELCSYIRWPRVMGYTYRRAKLSEYAGRVNGDRPVSVFHLVLFREIETCERADEETLFTHSPKETGIQDIQI